MYAKCRCPSLVARFIYMFICCEWICVWGRGDGGLVFGKCISVMPRVVRSLVLYNWLSGTHSWCMRSWTTTTTCFPLIPFYSYVNSVDFDREPLCEPRVAWDLRPFAGNSLRYAVTQPFRKRGWRRVNQNIYILLRLHLLMECGFRWWFGMLQVNICEHMWSYNIYMSIFWVCLKWDICVVVGDGIESCGCLAYGHFNSFDCNSINGYQETRHQAGHRWRHSCQNFVVCECAASMGIEKLR